MIYTDYMPGGTMLSVPLRSLFAAPCCSVQTKKALRTLWWARVCVKPLTLTCTWRRRGDLTRGAAATAGRHAEQWQGAKKKRNIITDNFAWLTLRPVTKLSNCGSLDEGTFKMKLNVIPDLQDQQTSRVTLWTRRLQTAEKLDTIRSHC